MKIKSEGGSGKDDGEKYKVQLVLRGKMHEGVKTCEGKKLRIIGG